MKAGRAICIIFLMCLYLFPAPTAQAVAEDQTLYEGNSIYHHITIYQDGGERCMIFGRQRDLRQTCINLARPDTSIFEYTSMMFAGFLFRPEAKRACIIGLGPGKCPNSDGRFQPGESSMVLFISTVGSFFGTNITAFYLISLFPVSRIVVGLGIICLAVSLIVLALGVDRRMPIPGDIP